ncbi:hypothetical protein Z517_06492 [Fonsecaea pedrosoi CBS 271.37]|uniref:Cupin type-1 domain-containing protein n=1 Tax=Fonsecaea pedrosoi CBS 271.37 TaxID=1442368 RepID=A0A0D2EZW6_9EURO|nr:uncharacterized protein Z517_06492 [Fonsecaea pedrosoi CBS 271.37]KIW79877.1 hypothetical protein Z517_06492 [Fonsecaea pedrosoi CBS 271.37]
MAEVKEYLLKPTSLVPNSPLSLLHYKKVLSLGQLEPKGVQRIFARNGWEVQWLVRYGSTQRSHYHSAVHECMAVFSGTATIRFGVADTVEDMQENTWGSGSEAGGVEVGAEPGDLFIIPAGVAHKTYDAKPAMDFLRLTGGDGRSPGSGENAAALLDGIVLSGFTMMGAYPVDGAPWDFSEGGEHTGRYDEVWKVPVPAKDPVFGESLAGLCGFWGKKTGGEMLEKLVSRSSL